MKFLSKVYKICENKDHRRVKTIWSWKLNCIFMEGMVEWCFEKGNRKKISSSTITKTSWWVLRRSFCKTDHGTKICYKHGITNPPFIKMLTICFALCYCPQIDLPSCNPIDSFSSSLQDPPLYLRPASISIFWELRSYTFVVLLQHDILPSTNLPFAQKLEDSITLLVKLQLAY